MQSLFNFAAFEGNESKFSFHFLYLQLTVASECSTYRFPRIYKVGKFMVQAASSAAGSPSNDFNPYEV